MNNEPVAWGMLDKDGGIYDSISPEEHDREEGAYTIPLYTHPAKTLTDRIAELENQLGFIASINRAGLGVVSGTPMPSEKIEKIWNSIEEQRDDNFHYGWKKCEQYYGFSYPAKTLTDKDLIEQIRNHFNISPTTSLTDPYPIRLVEILQYTKSILKNSQEDRVVSHEEQQEWLRTTRKTEY